MSDQLLSFITGESDTITRGDLLAVLASAQRVGRDNAPGRSVYAPAAMAWSWALGYLGMADAVREAVAQPGWRHVGENQPLGSSDSPVSCSMLHE